MVDTGAQYTIEEFSDKEIKVSFDSDFERIATVKVPYYNGWKAHINSNPIKIDKNSEGYISLNVPKGRSTLLLKFQLTIVYYLGLALTLFTLLIMGLYYFLSVRPFMKRSRSKIQTKS